MGTAGNAQSDSGPAMATSWVLDCAAVMRSRFSTCFSTVRGDRCSRAEAEPGARGQRGLGVSIGLVQLEPEHGRGGELQVDDGAGAGRAEFGGDVPRLQQAASARVVEHVDRAELMQSPQPPYREPGRVGRGEGQFEGLPGAVEIAGPADPAEQLQRPAPDLGARPRRGQCALGEGTRPVARVVGG